MGRPTFATVRSVYGHAVVSRRGGKIIPKKWPPPTYRVRAVFRAPLPFVFRWCTDYTPADARLEGERYARKILRRSDREVVYEDLEELHPGWMWARHVVRLYPPNRWHSESTGSHRQYSLEYRLSRRADGNTEFLLTARRRPYGIGGKNPPRAGWERDVTRAWRRFGRALEREYRATARRRPSR